MDALQFPARHVQIARMLRRRRPAEWRRTLSRSSSPVMVRPDVRVGHELHALGQHLLQTPVEHPFFHLEIGDAVAQQAADAVGLFENRYADARRDSTVARPPGLPDRNRRPRRAFRCGRRGGSGTNPAFSKGVLDDRLLDDLDRHRRLVDAQHAGRFAGRRADAAGELREIVGRMQHANGVAPAVADRPDRSSPE